MIVGGRREREREKEREMTSIYTSTRHNKPLHLKQGTMAHFPSLGVAAGHTLQWINPTAATSAIHTFLQARHVPRCYVQSRASEKSCSTRRAYLSLKSWLYRYSVDTEKFGGIDAALSNLHFAHGGLYSCPQDKYKFEINNVADSDFDCFCMNFYLSLYLKKNCHLMLIKLTNIIYHVHTVLSFYNPS